MIPTARPAAPAAKPKVKYTPQAAHAPPADAAEFLASLDPMNRRLHEIAVDKLGSSYFMEWTHGYKAWKKSKGT